MRNNLLCLTALAASLLAVPRSGAHDHHTKPACEPGYTLVEEIGYKDVIKKVCREVPDVQKKTKWVYDCVQEDFCLTKCRCPLHGLKHHHECEQCQSCSRCDRPMTKNLLVKRKVVEETITTKCVVETVVERVPYVIYHKVPCATPGAAPPLPEPLPRPKASSPPPATPGSGAS
jgi:hypothetical protein